MSFTGPELLPPPAPNQLRSPTSSTELPPAMEPPLPPIKPDPIVHLPSRKMPPKAASKAPAKPGMTLKQLTAFDDMCTDAMIDRVFYWTTILKNRGKYIPSRGIKEDDVVEILRKTVIEQKDIPTAELQILKLAGVKTYVSKLNTDQEKTDFKKHLRRYISLYHPDCPVEINATNRYTITTFEAAITARKRIIKGHAIKYLQGTQVAMTKEEEADADLTRKDFSIIITSRKKVPQVFLGPARFANHDCEPNADLKPSATNMMEVVALRDIEIGDEITVKYGDNYFDDGNTACLCNTCEKKLRNGWAPVDANGQKIVKKYDNSGLQTPDGKYTFRKLRRHGPSAAGQGVDLTPPSDTETDTGLSLPMPTLKRKHSEGQPKKAAKRKSGLSLMSTLPSPENGGRPDPNPTPANITANDLMHLHARLEEVQRACDEAADSPDVEMTTPSEEDIQPPTPSPIHTPYSPTRGFLFTKFPAQKVSPDVDIVDAPDLPTTNGVNEQSPTQPSGPMSLAPLRQPLLHHLQSLPTPSTEKADSISDSASNQLSAENLSAMAAKQTNGMTHVGRTPEGLDGAVDDIPHQPLTPATSSALSDLPPDLDDRDITMTTSSAEQIYRIYQSIESQHPGRLDGISDMPSADSQTPRTLPKHPTLAILMTPKRHRASPSPPTPVPSTVRKPKDYHLNPLLLRSNDATFARCLNKTCYRGPVNVSSQDYGYFICQSGKNKSMGEPIACPRCERHFKLYGLVWPQTEPKRERLRKGPDGEVVPGEVERRVDYRTVELVRGRRVYEGKWENGRGKWWYVSGEGDIEAGMEKGEGKGGVLGKRKSVGGKKSKLSVGEGFEVPAGKKVKC